MKSLRSFLPAAAIAIAGGIWFLRASDEGGTLQREANARRQAVAESPGTSSRPAAASDEETALARKVLELRMGLQRAEEAASADEKRIAEVRAKLPAMKEDEAIVSYGRITDMGAEAGQALRHVVGPLKGQKLGVKESDALASSLMKIVVWAPEIAGFEETPAEIASFESSMLRELLAFDETKTRQAETILRKHFDALKAAGLTAAHASAPQWRERRSEVLTQLLWQLRPLLPPEFNDSGLASVINIGAGLETKAESQRADEGIQARPAVQMNLPTWPRLPWLPPARN
jgi:hypothetical protein